MEKIGEKDYIEAPKLKRMDREMCCKVVVKTRAVKRRVICHRSLYISE